MNQVILVGRVKDIYNVDISNDKQVLDLLIQEDVDASVNEVIAHLSGQLARECAENVKLDMFIAIKGKLGGVKEVYHDSRMVINADKVVFAYDLESVK